MQNQPKVVLLSLLLETCGLKMKVQDTGNSAAPKPVHSQTRNPSYSWTLRERVSLPLSLQLLLGPQHTAAAQKSLSREAAAEI